MSNGLCFLVGFGIGFYLSMYILDRFYRTCMKDAIDEIHKGYKSISKCDTCTLKTVK